ncbi:MAG: pilus (MSHA type) biogenesis protein MshL [Gammaproteobacteria bacterium]|nr:pilus (MSHA type) biogenesis protein MshL [Gammaproteobacteria bacterium]MDH3749597.1 pilus (MSHA type) biogenesis protein MshL [Gammaproteobacteria bacterium]
MKTLTVSAVLLVLGGCDASMPTRESAPARGDVTRDSIEAALEDASTSPPPAEVAVPQPAEPALPMPVRPAEERFNLNSEDTPAQAFFMALVDQTEHNIVVHPEVAGAISLQLQDVTVGEVLELVSEVYGYSFRRGAAGYVVFPATLQSRIFQIDYLNLQRSGVSRTRISSGQVSESRQNGRQNNSALVGGLANQLSRESSRDNQQISGSGIETNYKADFWAELQDTLEQMIGDVEGHQVVVNSQTGVIVVRAMPDKLRSIGDYLETIQEIAQRQVVLEAKIVEVSLSDGFQSGINWVAVAQNSDGDTYTFGQHAPPPGYTGDPSDLGGAPITLEPGNPVTGFLSSTLGGAFTMAFDIGDFNAFIELLEQQGDTRVLSSPRVSTLNNQKAVIKAGTDEFFVTDVSSNTVTGTSSTTSRDVELTPFFSGIALDVTPQISADGQVTLHIHPTVSEVTDQQKILTVSGETDTLPLAFSEIRESDSIVKARSGQIIVIGGLMRNSTTEENFGVPGLSKIPGIGRLFKSKRAVERKTELVILLKPIVIDSDDTWTKMAGDSLERIRGNAGT